MRRSSNISISQWFRQNVILNVLWAIRAECGDHQSFPWTADIEPDASDLAMMRAVCDRCPVIVKCADQALRSNDDRGVDGGFYAGVWLPWTSPNESRETKLARERARFWLERVSA